MNYKTLVTSALLGLVGLAGLPARADNMASIAIAPATGAVTLTPRWAIGGNLAGFHLMAQDLSLGGGANQFYSIKGTPILAGGDITAFTRYIAGDGAATNHADIGSKLTPNSYLALTSADPDLGYGSVNFYLIHRKGTTDYFTAIIPSSGTASAVTDLKPMSGPGGPATVTGVSGYFGLTFAAANLGYGLNNFYYLRRDPVTGFTKFGTLDPALLGTAADKFDLGITGHNALAFTGSDVGYGTNKMYFVRLDPITGFSILGTLDPLTGRASDIANLGSVFSTLTFVPGDVGFGSGRFYTTGAVNTTWQSVSFAAIADRLISAGSFTVSPSASSTLPIALTVVPGSTGSASISGPVAGVFTITPTAPGVITLQATQAGSLAPAVEFNMLRQSFTATGATLLAITTQPTSQSAVTGTTANFSVTATGSSTVTYQWRKAGANIGANLSATTANLVLPNVQAADAANYDVVVTNASGSLVSNLVVLSVTGAAPVITNSPLTAAGTVGTPFSFTITASGSPTSYAASPLPAGLSIAAATGAITGTPTTVGTTSVLLGATNATGTGNATLTITVAAAGVAPIITNSPLTAGATVGTQFSLTITASGSPTSYAASPLPAGLSIVAATGAITGTPTTAGTTAVLLGATNATGTGNATLTITVAAAGVAPSITNSPLTAGGTLGTPFSFTITASGSPTSYSATPLPAGLSIVAATGAITGTPTTVGTTAVLLGATNATGTGNATLTITVAPVSSAPIILNAPLTAAGTVGAPFSFTIVTAGATVSFGASGLPPGLTLNAQTGTITGTPSTVGTTVVPISASSNSGSTSGTLSITIGPANGSPIVTSPLIAVGTVGAPFVTYLIGATGQPTAYTASGLPAGLALNPVTGAISGTPTLAGVSSVALTATNSLGTGTATLKITIAAAGLGPIISSPATATATVGVPFVTYLIAATGAPTGYTATGLPAGLTLNPLTGAINGTPTASGTFVVTLTATNAAGTTPATLTITVAGAAAVPFSQIVNFSARAISGPGNQSLIMGFVVAGEGTNLLVRGIGPGLAPYGVINPLADPFLTLFSTTGVLSTNDDWQTNLNGPSNATLIAATAARVGAFALPAGSKDSSLLLSVNRGAHTTGLLRPNSTTGVALTEIYDVDRNPGTRLVNVSARMNVTAGEGT
ncbi:MAG: putative Ig domain-containing protein, partial [Verrucomicrobia bacterium]|nr:putative Ig domain-containing protein [Verrucomicrobiota bacterium]